MKTIQEYDSDNHEDNYRLLRSQKSLDMYLALSKLATEFRKMRKYEDCTVTPEMFYDILNSYHIDLDELGE